MGEAAPLAAEAGPAALLEAAAPAGPLAAGAPLGAADGPAAGPLAVGAEADGAESQQTKKRGGFPPRFFCAVPSLLPLTERKEHNTIQISVHTDIEK